MSASAIDDFQALTSLQAPMRRTILSTQGVG